jgi:hypothetical protein
METECEKLISAAKNAFREEENNKEERLREIFEKRVLPVFPEAKFIYSSEHVFRVDICGHLFFSYFTKDGYKGLHYESLFYPSDGKIRLVNNLSDFGWYINFYEETKTKINKSNKQKEGSNKKISLLRKIINIFK